MASRKISTRNRGYTLIELLIVIALVLLMIGLALFVDLGNFLGDSFRAERNTLVTVLQTARANALNNVNQAPHGVAIHPADHPHSFVTFEGNQYSACDPSTMPTCQVFDENYVVTVEPTSPSQIVFCQLSGDVTQGYPSGTECEDSSNAWSGNITLTDPARKLKFNVTLNHEGGISW